MKNFAISFIVLLGLLTAACGGRKRDAVYYEHMVDSIRKAEHLKQMYKKAGIYDSPLEAFFDTLQHRTLPIQTAGAEWEKLGDFSDVPPVLCDLFDYPEDAKLKAVSLPRYRGYHVVMLVEEVDSVSPMIFLYTFDRHYKYVDCLCIYEQREEERDEGHGMVLNEYFVTSRYEVTLMYYFQITNSTTPELLSARRYMINKEGLFEETIIEQ